MDSFVFFNGNTHYCFLTSWNEVCTTSAVSVTARLVNFTKLKFKMIFFNANCTLKNNYTDVDSWKGCRGASKGNDTRILRSRPQ